MTILFMCKHLSILKTTPSETSLTDTPCSGAIKSNVGHLEGASGLAGLIKAVLILEKGIIPPNANFQKVNPKIDTDYLNISVSFLSFKFHGCKLEGSLGSLTAFYSSSFHKRHVLGQQLGSAEPRSIHLGTEVPIHTSSLTMPITICAFVVSVENMIRRSAHLSYESRPVRCH